MMITALMAGPAGDPHAKTYFDGLYKFFKDHLTTDQPPVPLMAWDQVKQGCADAPDGGGGTATDGDMDIAYALLLADKQWGSDGAINYLQEAKNVINAIMEKEINQDTSLPLLADGDEDWLQDDLYKYGTRPSDFIEEHFRAYQSATGDARWTDAIDATYDLIETMQTNYSLTAGLLPDFVQDTNTSSPKPVPPDYLEGENDGKYFYNACRVPWRIGIDYLISGNSRALQVLNTINTWIQGETGSDPSKIVDGYELDGTPTGTGNAVAFIVTFGVGAMVSANNQQWLNKIWDLTVSNAREQSDYFGNTLKVLAMITMSGNWWKPTT